MIRPALACATLAALAALAACASPPMAMRSFDQGSLPPAVQVPGAHRVAMETVGTGSITYECRARADAPGAHEWFFVGPDARLADRGGRMVGRYYGPPATWESIDGSRVTATQVAVSPAGPGNIPLQLVKADPAMGQGAMTGVTYIQRVATQGGVAPATPCSAGNLGARQVVQYRADYILYKAM